jgi:hypothetical protein
MKSKILTVIVFVILLIVIIILAVLLHEFGHGWTAELLGGEFLSVYVYPGIQVWPEFGVPFSGEWDGYAALMYYNQGPHWEPGGWQPGLVSLMGSGANLLFSFIALLALWAFQPRGLVKLILAAEGLMYMDIVLYTFATLAGGRHLLFIGGEEPEPLVGAMAMGIPRDVFLAAVGAIFIVFTWMFFALIRSPRKGMAGS